jgi:hypothetical protein
MDLSLKKGEDFSGVYKNNYQNKSMFRREVSFFKIEFILKNRKRA